jgi:uncharacterized membrane protein YdjX (TVP38/TMEM64 family)
MKSAAPFKWKWIWMVFLLGGLLSLLFYRYHSFLWMKTILFYEILRDHHRLKEIISSFGPYAPLAYIFLQVIQVVVAPIPGGPIEFLGGYLFGIKAGFIYSMIGLILGSLLAFSLARVFEKKVVEKFVSLQTRKKLDYLMGHGGVILSFLLFIIPVFPKDALCYILGLTPMHFGVFLIISTIGRFPGTLMATLQGAKAFDEQYKMFLFLLGFSILVILFFYVYYEEIHRWIKKWKGIER